MVDTIPALAWAARADGSADFFNQSWLDYTGLSAEQARDLGWTVALHPHDRYGHRDAGWPEFRQGHCTSGSLRLMPPRSTLYDYETMYLGQQRQSAYAPVSRSRMGCASPR